MRNGSERVVTSARDHLYDLKGLEDYQFRDENDRDQGINGERPLIKVFVSQIGILILFFTVGCLVRQKVKEMIALLQDDNRLREERRKAKKTKDKYVGVSSEDSFGGNRYST